LRRVDTYWQEKILRPIPSPSIASSPGDRVASD
jgi:hypothetical protein